MDIHQLECFVFAARNNNFTKAASEMHISQPALSSCIRLLENELGVKLFERSGKKILLNDVGIKVLEHVNIIMNECDAIKQMCRETTNSKNNRVAVLTAVTRWIVPYLLNDFAVIHPDIRLEIVIEELNAKRLVNAKEADIAVMASVNEISTENMRTVYKEEIMLAVPLGHDLAGRGEINLIELKPYSIISLTQGRPLRSIEDTFCRLAGFTPTRSIESDSSAILCELIEDGYGPAFMPIKSWKELNISEDRLVRIKNPSCFRYVSVKCSDIKSKREPAIRKTFDYIVSLLEQDA